MENLNYVKDKMLNVPNAISNTPFAKDVMAGGVFGIITATQRGIERENLKKKCTELENKFSESLKVNMENVTQEYDLYSENFVHKDIVKEKKDFLTKKLNKLKLKHHLSGTNIQNKKCDLTKTNPNADPNADSNMDSNVGSDAESITDSNEWYINIFEFENGKYYINRTKETNNSSSSVTKSPGDYINGKKIISICYEQSNSPFDEDCFVKKYMSEYGIKNVRGGSYSSDNLTYGQIVSLQKELMYAENKKITCSEELNMNDINSTYISTYLLHEYCKYSVEEISELKQLTVDTINFHLKKCNEFELCIN